MTTVDDFDRAELQAHRNGIGHLAEDPMHAGQTVWRLPDLDDGEVRYRLQVSHADTPIWQCGVCRKLTVHPNPDRCVGCGTDDDRLEPLLYEQPATCRSWPDSPRYDGACQLEHWDGCLCADGEEDPR